MLNKSVKYRKSCIFHSNSDQLPWLPNPLPLHQILSVPNIPALDVVTYPAASPLSAAELSPKVNSPVVYLLQDQMPSLCSHSSLLSLHHCFQPHMDYFLSPVFRVPPHTGVIFTCVCWVDFAFSLCSANIIRSPATVLCLFSCLQSLTFNTLMNSIKLFTFLLGHCWGCSTRIPARWHWPKQLQQNLLPFCFF